jgi:hypothetical protein
MPMIEQPQETCDVCRRIIPEGAFRIISRKVLNRLQKRTSITLRCICIQCSKSIKKTAKGDALTAVVWLRKVNNQIENGIFPPGIHEMIEDAEKAKKAVSSSISRMLTEVEEKTISLNFISSSLIEVRNAYGKYLWDTYEERRKRANYAISQRDLRLMVFTRDRYRCKSCGAGKKLTIDHINPVAKGGDESFENLQTLCRSCNSSKGAR